MFDAFFQSLAALLAFISGFLPFPGTEDLSAARGSTAPAATAAAAPATPADEAAPSTTSAADQAGLPASEARAASYGPPPPETSGTGSGGATSESGRGESVVGTAPEPAVATLRIAELGIERSVYDAVGRDGADIGALIDACRGAVLYYRQPAELSVIAAHRTGCGDRGFGGVETLGPGSSVTIDVNGTSTSFAWVGSHQAPVGGLVSDVAAQLDDHFDGIALQTSLSSSLVVFQFFQRQ